MRVYYIVSDWKDLKGAGGIDVGKFAEAMPSSKYEGMITNTSRRAGLCQECG